MFIFLLILFVCILLLPSCARADEGVEVNGVPVHIAE